MEHPDSHKSRERIYKNGTQQHQLVKSDSPAIDKNPIGQDARKNQQQEVQYQYTPIRQRLLTKVPTNQISK